MVAACGERDDGPFTYDAGASLEIRQGISTEQRGQRVSYLTYASPKGGRVPALLVTPAGRGPFAGVIVQHGMPSRRSMS